MSELPSFKRLHNDLVQVACPVSCWWALRWFQPFGYCGYSYIIVPQDLGFSSCVSQNELNCLPTKLDPSHCAELNQSKTGTLPSSSLENSGKFNIAGTSSLYLFSFIWRDKISWHPIWKFFSLDFNSLKVSKTTVLALSSSLRVANSNLFWAKCCQNLENLL